jgi:hypothetical protein
MPDAPLHGKDGILIQAWRFTELPLRTSSRSAPDRVLAVAAPGTLDRALSTRLAEPRGSGPARPCALPTFDKKILQAEFSGAQPGYFPDVQECTTISSIADMLHDSRAAMVPSGLHWHPIATVGLSEKRVVIARSCSWRGTTGHNQFERVARCGKSVLGGAQARNKRIC